MNLSIILLVLVSVLPANLQKIADGLASNKSEIRKTARKEAFNLSKEDKKILIEELKNSSDPELTETAKELNQTIEKKVSAQKIIKLISDGNNEEIIKLIKTNQELFKKPILGNFTGPEIAKALNNNELVEVFVKQKIADKIKQIVIFDVLIVESDTWDSLANDFNTQAELIKLLNQGKDLKPGIVIKVPQNN